MLKHSFLNDYSEGAHPRVLQLLSSSNLTQEAGYGEDSLSLRAADLLRAATGIADADVHLVSGGTQANLIALASMLRPYESIIAADSAQIVTAVGATHALDIIARTLGDELSRATERDVRRGRPRPIRRVALAVVILAVIGTRAPDAIQCS